MDEVAHDLDGLIFGKILPFLDVGIQVAPIAVLHDEVEIVGSLLHIVQSDDVGVLATF